TARRRRAVRGRDGEGRDAGRDPGGPRRLRLRRPRLDLVAARGDRRGAREARGARREQGPVVRPIRTKTNTETYRGPMPSIADLPFHRKDGGVVSTWELTPEEREMIANGANIEFVCFSEPHPPISLSVTGDGEDEQTSADDLRCEECGALYVRDRGLAD